MPVDALPQPHASAAPGTVPLRREYRDALGRPLVGKVTLTPKAGGSYGEVTVPAVPVDVELAAGVLQVELPPDTYTLTGRLRAPGGTVNVRDEVTLEADSPARPTDRGADR